LTGSPPGTDDREESGGASIRRLLPVVVLVPIVLDALRYLAVSAGIVNYRVGTTILVIVYIVLGVVGLLWVARIIDDAEERRLRIERANKEAAPALAERAAALERANAELAETTERLERSNAELQQFATVASHDLREPLRVVSGFAELLARRHSEQLGPDGQRFVEAITGGVARMDEMISDLLAYARAGRSDQPLEPVDMNVVVADTLSALQRAIDESHAQIEVDELPTVTGNHAALGQLFQNLIANAIKFVEDGPPRIRIWAAEVPEGWRFSVRDNGIGVDPSQAEKIFVMFQRMHGSERFSGTGVGLAVCQRIVSVHGGRIWVEPAPGGGSQFMFTIARAPTNGASSSPQAAQA
jgi:light-regulated signal transduction histidine kinase (bacteriophytochrome)